MFTSDRSERIFTACVQCIKKDIIPLTAQGVKGGSKVYLDTSEHGYLWKTDTAQRPQLFGAAILRQDDLSSRHCV